MCRRTEAEFNEYRTMNLKMPQVDIYKAAAEDVREKTLKSIKNMNNYHRTMVNDKLNKLTEMSYNRMKEEFEQMIRRNPEDLIRDTFQSSTMTYDEFIKKYGKEYLSAFGTNASSYLYSDPELWKYLQEIMLNSNDCLLVNDMFEKRKRKFIEERELLGNLIINLENALNAQRKKLSDQYDRERRNNIEFKAYEKDGLPFKLCPICANYFDVIREQVRHY